MERGESARVIMPRATAGSFPSAASYATARPASLQVASLIAPKVVIFAGPTITKSYRKNFFQSITASLA
jgi:hypothetical protein